MLITWPSGSARATCCAAMRPPAPSLFSTITGWPRLAMSLSARMRAIVSEALPGDTPETRRIGLLGKPCPAATHAIARPARNAATLRIDVPSVRLLSRQAELLRHPVGAAAPIAVWPIIRDMVAVVDHEELDRPLRVGGDALRVLPRNEPILLAGDEEERAFDPLRRILERERAGV